MFGVGMSPLRQRGGVLLFEECDDILSVEDASAIMKMGKNAIYTLLLNRELKGFKNGRVWRIPKRAIVEYVSKASQL